jgi:FkbM family methyltransferase
MQLRKLVNNRYTRAISPSVKAAERTLIFEGIRHRLTREVLNKLYAMFPVTHTLLHRRYTMLPITLRHTSADGLWQLWFAGTRIVVPLRRDSFWLDWGFALGVLGHDAEVKRTYEMLLLSDRPDLFIDIGANYGTHSMLMAAAGVPVLAFEPNPHCLTEWTRAIMRLNRVASVQWESIALGNSNGRVKLTFPEHETWLGSIVPSVSEQVAQTRTTMLTLPVPIERLDDRIDFTRGKRLLIKIDTEGAEQEVLLGAERTIKELRPKLIFESNDQAGRQELMRLLSEHGYGVFPLPYDPLGNPLGLTAFAQSNATNFLARSLV